MASEKIWKAGTPTPPQEFDYDRVHLVDSSSSSVPVENGMALRWSQTSNNNGGTLQFWDLDVDFSGYDTLNVTIGGDFSSSQWTLKIRVDSNELLSTTNNSTRDVSLDVSGISGVHTLRLGGQNEVYNGSYHMDFGNIELQ